MESHFELTDAEFESQFRNGSLTPRLFTHEAHLRLAWIHLSRYHEVEKAAAEVCKQIKRFDRLHGDGTKFHHTLTVAAVRTVHHFRQKSEADNFADFIQEFPRLKSNFKDLLDFHYSSGVIQQEDARHQYLEPDLLPFS